MRAADIMTTGLLIAEPEMTVREAAEKMIEAGVSGMPVVNACGRLVGMVTEGDLLHHKELATTGKGRTRWLQHFTSTRNLASEYVKQYGRRVKDVMTTEVATVSENCPVSEIAELLEGKHIKRVPEMHGGQLGAS